MTDAVPAWIAFAFVDVVFAVDADDSGYADAFVAAGILVREWLGEDGRQCVTFRETVQRFVRSLQTLAIVLTRRTLTLVYVDLAILARVASMAIALKYSPINE